MIVIIIIFRPYFSVAQEMHSNNGESLDEREEEKAGLLYSVADR